MTTQQPQIYGTSKINSKEGAHSNTGLPQKTTKVPYNQSKLSHKGIRKRTTKSQREKKKGNNKDQSINK